MEDHQLQLILQGIEIQTSEIINEMRQLSEARIVDKIQEIDELERWKAQFLANMQIVLEEKTEWGRNDVMQKEEDE